MHMTKKMLYILYTGFFAFVVVVHYSIKVADEFSPTLRSKKEVRRNVLYKRELRNKPNRKIAVVREISELQKRENILFKNNFD